MKKIKQTSIYIAVIVLSIFVGYENPKLVENPKKYYKYFFEKEWAAQHVEFMNEIM